MTRDPVLRVRDLKVHFPVSRGWLVGSASAIRAVDGVSFDVRRGTTFALVGESGSGKTTTAQAIMRLAPVTDGQVQLGDADVTAARGKDLLAIRRRLQMVFQDPYSSLNPRMRAGRIVREPMDLLDVGPEETREARVADLFDQVGLRPEQQQLFPHQFSGGQRQRIGIARALASQPEVLVCDEPVSSLDVAIQAQIVNLLRDLQAKHDLTFVFIAHDLGLVQYVCDEIGVMYAGEIVEHAERTELFKAPLHPYTWSLLSAVPSVKTRGRARRVRLQGEPPSSANHPQGCRFAPRCPFAEARCHATPPRLRVVGDGSRKVACHLVTDDGRAPQHAR